MTKRVDYIGNADVRLITAAQFALAGITSPDLSWSKANNFERDVPDDVALFLTAADTGFVIEGGPAFGDSIVPENMVLVTPVGMKKSMGPKNPLAPIANTTTETTLLVAPVAMPKMIEDAVWTVKASGVLGNNSGSPINFTFRLKNLTDAITWATLGPLSIPTDTSTARPWRLEIDGEGTVVFTAGNISTGELEVGAGAVDTAKKIFSQNAGSAPGTDPQNWDLTVQMGTAHANASVAVYTAVAEYTLAA